MTQPTDAAQTASRRRPPWLALALLAIGLALVAFFGLRAVRSFMRLQRAGLQPGASDVAAIRGWMTIPYIAKVFGVPEAYLFEQLGIPPAGNQERSLADLNRRFAAGEQGVVLARVQAAIRRYWDEHPPTPEAAHD